jgi:multisubunit Na+/H+ antiporter MnhF subunit
MEALLAFVLHASLTIHLILVGVCVYKVWRGQNSLDRLVGADVIGTIALAVLVLIGLIEQNSIYIDAAVGLAALSFIGSIALAKFIAERKVQ